MRNARLHLVALILLCVAWCVVDRGQPLVRNSLVYARAAWNVADAGFDPRPVVADSRLSYDKPIGFAWLAAPLVAKLGAHDGLRSLLLGATLLVAFLMKNYALVLVPSCGLYLWLQRGAIARDGRSVRRRVAWCAPVLLAVTAFIVAARFGMSPLSRLEGEGGGADQFAFRHIGSIWWKTLAQVGLALALQFHVTLVFMVRRTAVAREVVLPLLCFGAIYVAGLLPFPTAFYNMRYFLPLFPLVALAIVRGAEPALAAPRGPLVKTVAIAFLVVNGATTLLFNVPALYDRVAPHLPDTRVTWLAGGPPLALLDNLRMELHRQQAAWLDAVAANVEAGALLYLVDVVYYRDAQQHVFERDGRIRPDVTTRYVGRRDFHPDEAKFYVWSFTGQPLQLERFGRVTDLGHRLFRVEAKLE